MHNPLFTDIERQVIALAASSAVRECGGNGGLFSRLAAAGARLLTGVEARPLANPRLEALRRLACAAFASGGRVADRAAEAARSAGLSQAQIAGVAHLAAARDGAFA